MSGKAEIFADFFDPRKLFQEQTMRASSWVTPYSVQHPDERGDLIETGHGSSRLAVSDDAVWATNAASKTAARIDLRSGRVGELAELGREPIAVATAGDTAWVVCTNGWLWRFNPGDIGEGVARLDRRAREIACDERTTWVLHSNGHLDGVDQASGEVVVEGKVRRGGRELLAVGNAVLALTERGTRVVRVAPDTGQVEAEAKLPAHGIRAAALDGTLWVACVKPLRSSWGALVPVDLGSMEVGPPLKLPNAPRAIAAGAGCLWVACGRRGDKKSEIFRVSPAGGECRSWDESDWTIYDLAIAGGRLMAAAGVYLSAAAGGGNSGSGAGGGGGGHHGAGGGGGNC
jgi:hypothetical protein